MLVVFFNFFGSFVRPDFGPGLDQDLNLVLSELKESGEATLLQHSLLEELNLDIVAALGKDVFHLSYRIKSPFLCQLRFLVYK